MPRKYERKTKIGAWSPNQLQNAVDEIRQGMSIRSASVSFDIPYSTLRERIVKQKNNAPRLGMKAVFNPEQEKLMAEHLFKMAQMFYGLTRMELRRAAYVYAEKNGIPHRFNKVKELAGTDWLNGFLKRNEGVRVRKPEATSINRIKAFNRDEVKVFYDNLEEVMSKYNFQPDRIYNFDETGKSIVQKPQMILAKKGMKRVGAVTSAERGKNHTVACAVSASGHYIPPMFIFPRVRMSPSLTIGGPPGSIYKTSKSGWITEQLFIEWLKHFKVKSNPSLADPILLILDNHTTHCSVEAYDFCIENGIVVLSIPPHTSHRLQPLDLTIFGPLNTALNKAIEAEMKLKNYVKITSEQLPSLFHAAWTKICSTEKAVNGFRSAGIYPFNRNVFSDDEYYVDNENEPAVHDAEIATIQIEQNENLVTDGQSDDGESEYNTDPQRNATENQMLFTDVYMELTEEELMNNGFVVVEPLLSNNDEDLLTDSTVQIEFSSIVTVPKISIQQNNSRKKREKQHSEIMTSSAYKVVLNEKKKRREIREMKKLSVKTNNVPKMRGRPKKNPIVKVCLFVCLYL